MGFQIVTGKVVKGLLIANVALYILQLVAFKLGGQEPIQALYLTPSWLSSGAIWQLFTYMFFHDPTGIFHIVFNCLLLWMFGSELEIAWGKAFFAKYYLICGVGAGIFYYLVSLIFLRESPGYHQPMLGASGAIYGLLLGYGIYFADRTLIFMFFFPMKAKYMVMIIGAIELVMTVLQPNSTVANAAHLGGLLVGFFYLFGFAWLRKLRRKKGGDPSSWPGGTRQEKSRWKRAFKKSSHLKLVVNRDPEETFEKDNSDDDDGGGKGPTWH